LSENSLRTVAVLHGLFFSFFYYAVTSPYTPKPTGYFKIDLPEKNINCSTKPGYPYTFEYPTYAHVVKDSTFFGDETENPWWLNVEFPQFSSPDLFKL
jgi:hypothetical protein